MAFGNATKGYVKSHSGGGGGGGTTNYSELSNKPSINGVTLDGNKTSEDLGITGGGGATLTDITNLVSENNKITLPKTYAGGVISILGYDTAGGSRSYCATFPLYNGMSTYGYVKVYSDQQQTITVSEDTNNFIITLSGQSTNYVLRAMIIK